MENLLDISLLQDDLSLQTISINLSLAFFLSLVLKWHFEKFGTVFSGKHEVARSLIFLTLIVCFIISVVKSSLALSLGLVGALSIVRFRTAIKEAEELIYLFMAIAIGLGMGANQPQLTVVSTFLILFFVSLSKYRFLKKEIRNFYISVESSGSKKISPQEITNLITKNLTACSLKKIETSAENLQLIYQIYTEKPEKLFETIETLENKLKNLHITFIDQSRNKTMT